MILVFMWTKLICNLKIEINSVFFKLVVVRFLIQLAVDTGTGLQKNVKNVFNRSRLNMLKFTDHLGNHCIFLNLDDFPT